MESDVPAPAKDAGLTLPLSMQTVQDTVENLQTQVEDASMPMRIRALAHYAERDAFIVLD